ncbi:hypothetical protein N657DRAFT_639148 [Parathielavia appendiculata]|uniref:MIP18 family-like domain-containing protein n=1 Tax=Parathielavia appendiculata TaxID=2587402 RepID=A0AAN6Z874_9PEZI|nr:hypothetical protein N657DRAFT_639148 [Parathielavia appendiculata]
MERDLDNANPTILSVSQLPSRTRKGAATRNGPDSKCHDIVYPQHHWPYGCSSSSDEGEDYREEPMDEQDIYDLISTISDPEHPHTLGQLSVVRLPDIHLSPSPTELSGPDSLVTVLVELTPTINHCSLATVIGLAVRCRLEQTLPPNYRVDVRMKVGSHAQDDQVNKQLGDKERVAAALENDTLQRMVDKMLETCA